MSSLKEDLARLRRGAMLVKPITEDEKIAHGIRDMVPAPSRQLSRRSNQPPEGKSLPASLEAEMGILGSILRGGEKVMYLCEQKLGDNYFHDPRNGKIFHALKEMHSDHLSLDLITVTNELEKRCILEEVGGASYVTGLFTYVESGTNVIYYIELVRKKFALRQLILTATKAAADAFSPDADPAASLTTAADELNRIERIVLGERDETLESPLVKLNTLDTKNDPNAVLGYRWLCRGGSCLWVGQAGLGKSSLAMQAGVMWAQALSLWGILPTQGKRLKSLFIQAENDEGDMAEMLQGVLRNCPLPPGVTQEQFVAELQKYMIFHRDVSNTGKDFAKSVARLIAKHKPDLVWVDPLLSYVGGDLSSQEVASHFLRNLMNPIAMDYGIVWMMLHHTGKPSADPKSRSTWTDHDFSYAAFGSSELVNWARAVNVLRSVGNGVFELRLAKRGKRAGMKEFDEFEGIDTERHPQLTDIAYLQHSKEGIFWEQIAKPAEIDEKKTAIGKQFEKLHSPEDIIEVLSSQSGGRRAGELQKIVKDKKGISYSTFYRYWNGLTASKKVIEDTHGRWTVAPPRRSTMD